MSEPQQSLFLVIPERGIMAPDTVTSLEATFGPLYARADDLMRQASLVKVTALDQLGHMQTAKTVRLQLRTLRGEIAAAHKAAKEDSLKKGRAIDLIKNTAVDAIGKAEDYLLEQEEFKVRYEREQRDGLRADRVRLLSVFSDLIPLPTFELADLSTEDFTTLLEGTQARHEKEKTRREQEAAVQAQREQAERLERERLEAENAKLKAEKEAQDAEAKRLQNLANLEKARTAAALKKQQDEAERLKRELAQKEAEERERQVQLETEARQRETEKQQAQSAPDAEKIGNVAAQLEVFRDSLPTMASGAGTEIMKKFHAHLTQSVGWLKKQQATLE